MTATNASPRNQPSPTVAEPKTLTLAERLLRSLDEDPTSEEPWTERWDDDEGSFGG